MTTDMCPPTCRCHMLSAVGMMRSRTSDIQVASWIVVQGLIGKLSKGDLPLVKASGPFGCAQGPKWAAHRVLVIFAGGIGVCQQIQRTVDRQYTFITVCAIIHVDVVSLHSVLHRVQLQ